MSSVYGHDDWPMPTAEDIERAQREARERLSRPLNSRAERDVLRQRQRDQERRATYLRARSLSARSTRCPHCGSWPCNCDE